MTESRPIRWSLHAIGRLNDQAVDAATVEDVVRRPDFDVPSQESRRVRMRRYHDADSRKAMLLRVVVEESQDEIVVVTVNRTSQVARYLRGLEAQAE